MKRHSYFTWFVALFTFVPGVVAEKVPGRYIVELSSEPVTEFVTRTRARGGMRSAAASGHRTRLRAEQQQMRGRLEQRRARITESVDTVSNAIFVEASEADAAQLASLPGVKRVLPVRKLHLALDRTVLIHRIADVWNEVGKGNAGAGIKIAIIDTGVEVTHPGFHDSSLPVPDGFPKASRSSDLTYTNNKVIVARSYVNLLPGRDSDQSARDRVGHGTALAMIAAGVRSAGPLATIEGVAPKAYIGNYKVFGSPGSNDSTTDEAVLKAMDDAVADGMDVINLSLGTDIAPRLADDPEVVAVERATRAGVIVVVAAGNNGPDLNTMSSPGTAPSAISVGAITNDRTFASSVDVSGLGPVLAFAGDGAKAPVTASITDIVSIDSTGLACSTLPSNSLRGRIALIQRGTCSFETKLLNAERAGAIGGIIFAAAESPDPFSIAVGTANIPAEMIGFNDGQAIKQLLSSGAEAVGTLQFALGAVPLVSRRLTDFSASGPSVDLAIKPDLLAVGGDMYVATQTLDQRGEMYDASGFILEDGTSFSTPVVAGAAALLKSARPGLTVAQYRSLLINSAGDGMARDGQVARVQQSGAGVLDMVSALHTTVAAFPTSLSFGGGDGFSRATRTLTITNLGNTEEDFVLSANTRDNGPSLSFSGNTVHLMPGASANVPVSFESSGLAPGPYEGFVSVSGASSGSAIRVPYWYAVRSTEPAKITLLDSLSSGRRGTVQRDAVLFRITDASGLPMADVHPEITVVSGGGDVSATNNFDSEIPGMFGLDLRLGGTAGTNVFRIQAGTVKLDVAITSR